MNTTFKASEPIRAGCIIGIELPAEPGEKTFSVSPYQRTKHGWPIGAAARDIQKGELLEFSPVMSTTDILVRTRTAP